MNGNMIYVYLSNYSKLLPSRLRSGQKRAMSKQTGAYSLWDGVCVIILHNKIGRHLLLASPSSSFPHRRQRRCTSLSTSDSSRETSCPQTTTCHSQAVYPHHTRNL